MVREIAATRQRHIGNIELLGGRLSVDFTNTLDWRGIARPVELLRDYQDLVTWSRCVGIVNDREANRLLRIADGRVQKRNSVTKRAIVLREALYRIFSSLIRKKQPSPADLAVFNRELSSAMARSQVSTASTGFVWRWTGAENRLDRILWPVVKDAAELLTSGPLDRLGMCSDGKCAWLFLDTSKNRQRRWCSMNDCGNRAKALRHYKRKHHSNNQED